MSKENPNQDYYKTAGKGQSEGPDRVHANANDDKPTLDRHGRDAKHANHPAVMRSKTK